MPNQHLYLLRKRNHLSQEQVARKLNMTSSAYGKLERGQTRLTTDRLYELANIFRIDPNDILHPGREKEINIANSLVNKNETYDLQRNIIAIFKHQVESLIWSKYASIIINYEGTEAQYDELPDFLREMYKEDYNIYSKEDYDNDEFCLKPYYNTDEEEYYAFKKLIVDSDIYYFFKNGLYDFEEDVTLSRCWKKYQDEKAISLVHTYPAKLKLPADMIIACLRNIDTKDLFECGDEELK